MTTPATAIQVQWLTKAEAAKRLDVSERRILEFAQAGVLESAKQRDPASGQMATVIHAGAVERFKDQRDQPRPAEPRDPQAVAVHRAAVKKPAEPGGIAPPQTAAQPAPLCAWLTLEQAETYTGLPASELLSYIKVGNLLALDVGVRPGGRYRVKRADLDAIEGMRFAGDS